MSLVVLERRVDPPIGLDDVRAAEASGAWCLEMYRVEHRTSLLSLDGRRLCCAFDAPDAESVRAVLNRLEIPFESAWPATLHQAPGAASPADLAAAGPALVLVERRLEAAIEPAEIDALGARAAWCSERHGARFLRAYAALDRRRVLAIYASPDAESVRVAYRQAGIPFADLWPARAYEVPG